VKQLAGKPFALLGVHGFDYPSAKLKAVMDKEQLNWRSLSSRAIATRWSARHADLLHHRSQRGDPIQVGGLPRLESHR
jgi:hypothetical protein